MDHQEVFPILGYTKDRHFYVFSEDYEFTFLQTDKYEDGVFGGMETILPQDGFINFLSYDGCWVGIYFNRGIEIKDHRCIKTYCCIKNENPSKEPVKTFNAITFIGGTLNKLFYPQRIEVEPKSDRLIKAIKNDKQSYNAVLDGRECNISVYSKYSWSHGMTGTRIQNDTVKLRFCFVEAQPVAFAITCYHSLIECMRFMSNRQGVDIDEIVLHTEDTAEDDNNDAISDIVHMYVRKNEKLTDKDHQHNILFNDLLESSARLLEIIFISQSIKKQFFIGFYPEDNTYVNRISNDQVRSICSALEREFSLLHPRDECSDVELENLKESVKEYIKNHRSGETSIPASTYDLIFGSIDHWSNSAKDRIDKLIEVHKDVFEMIKRRIPSIYALDIGQFIKYRNTITHNGDIWIPEEIAATAIALRGLVYCCILSRAGVPEERIMQMCELKINT